MQSQAFFLHKKGSPEEAFELRSFEISDPKNTEILLEVEAFGLNYADVMARRGLYKEAPEFPCVVGYEVVGKVISIGENAEPSLLGKRVIAFCRFGGYAKHAISNDYSCVVVEDQPVAELLALTTQAVTAYYMSSYIAPIHATDTVLIHAAAGGVGTLLVQMAKMKGATVIAKVGRKEKENLVKTLGADFVVNYNESDYIEQIKSLLGNKKIDVSYNPVGGSTYKKDFSILNSGGRLVLFGGSELGKGKWGILSALNFVRKMGLVIPVGLMMSSRSVLGVNMLKIADNKPEVLEYCLKSAFSLYKEGKIIPQIGGVFSQEEFFKAHALLESGKSTGKLVVVWDEKLQ